MEVWSAGCFPPLLIKNILTATIYPTVIFVSEMTMYWSGVKPRALSHGRVK